jgi:putative ABC transport system substrate-binding protein
LFKRFGIVSVALFAVVGIAFVVRLYLGMAGKKAVAARIGVLSPFSTEDDAFLPAFRTALGELGYREREDFTLEYRSAEGHPDRLVNLAIDLVGKGMDLIVTTGPSGVQATLSATRTIPIVMAGVDDAEAQGFVDSLANPGRNATGISWLNRELSAKRLAILKEAIPKLTRVAVLRDSVGGATLVGVTESAARSLGIRLDVYVILTTSEIPNVFAAIKEDGAEGIVVLSGPLIVSEEHRIVDGARHLRLPTIFPDARFARIGGLLSYGPALDESYRLAAVYADKILRGAKPADLPVQQPTTFQLLVNLGTARALGIQIPPSVMLRADEVIR